MSKKLPFIFILTLLLGVGGQRMLPTGENKAQTGVSRAAPLPAAFPQENPPIKAGASPDTVTASPLSPEVRKMGGAGHTDAPVPATAITVAAIKTTTTAAATAAAEVPEMAAGSKPAGSIPRQGFTFAWEQDGVMRIQPGAGRAGSGLSSLGTEAEVSIHAEGMGFGENPAALAAPVTVGASASGWSAARPAVEEFYRPSEEGLEHGFILSRRPEGADRAQPLKIALTFQTSLRAALETPDRLVLSDARGKAVWSYSRLLVEDANRERLDAWMEFREDDAGGHQVLLCMDESTAAYPLVVDPTFASEELGALGNPSQLMPDLISFTAAGVMGDALYFNADDGVYGQELWRTDLLTGETGLVKDIYPGIENSNPGIGDSYPRTLLAFKNHLYFAALRNLTQGAQMWRTDGTAAGTTLFRDFYPSGRSAPTDVLEAGDFFYFRVQKADGTYQLWRCDGSTEGTVLLIDTPALVPDLTMAALLGNRLIYPGKDAAGGEEIWSSDGTPAGTRLLKDIVPGTSGSRPGKPIKSGNRVYFVVQQGSAFRPELWTSDGSGEGTARVPTGESVPGTVLAFQGMAVFNAASPELPAALWKTDGTTEGTKMIRNLSTDASNVIQPLTATESLVFFTYHTASEASLWKSDGTTAGTVKVKSLGNSEVAVTRPMAAGGRMFFVVNTPANGQELWVSDGSAAGTTLVKEILPGTSGSDPFPLIVAKGQLYLAASDGFHGRELWRSDGTAAGTVMVKDIVRPSNYQKPSDMRVLGNSVFFQAWHPDTGRELWMYDGTRREVRVAKEFVAGSGSGFNVDAPQHFVTAGGYLYCAPNSPDQPVQSLWRTDGTEAGTVRLKNNVTIPGQGNVSLTGMAAFGNLMLFPSWTDGQVWRTDGTVEGTFSLGAGWQEIIPAGNYALFSKPGSREASGLMRTDGTVAGTYQITPEDFTFGDNIYTGEGISYFLATDSVKGRRCWMTDGTTAGTGLVPGLSTETAPPQLFLLGNVGRQVYLRKNFSTRGELWTGDGRPGGSRKVCDLPLNPSPASWPAKTLFYFGIHPTTKGGELWRSDGTVAGTFRLRSFLSENASFDRALTRLTTVGDKLFFLASTETIDHELWVTDGTAAGTQMLADILPGFASSRPVHLLTSGRQVYFAATDAEHGREVWVTDGTPAGTRLTEDLNPGLASSLPFWGGEADGHLIFMYERDPATDGTGVRELIVTPQPQAITGPAQLPGGRSVLLTGGIDPDSSEGQAWFEYGPTTEYGSRTPDQAVTADGPVTALLEGLPAASLIHYRVVYQSGGKVFSGVDMTAGISPLRVFAGAGTGGMEILDRQTAPALSVETPEGTGITGQFTLVNAGAQPWEIRQILLPETYSLKSVSPPLTIPAGESRTFEVSQFSAVPGEFTGMVTVRIADPYPAFTFPVSVKVLLVNDPPVIHQPPVFYTPEDTLVSGTLTAEDPDRQPLTFSLAGPVTNGTATVSPDGHFTFTPAADFSGTATIPVRVNDTLVDSETVVVNIQVLAVADPPILDPLPLLSTAEDTLLTGKVTGKSPEALPLQFSLAEAPDAAAGKVTLFSDGTFLFQPAPDYSGAAGFFVKASDGTRESAKMLVVILITPVNDVPFLTAHASLTAVSGMPLPGVAISATDVDTPVSILQWSVATDNPLLLPLHAIQLTAGADAAGRILSLAPAEGLSGNVNITLTVSDGQASTVRTIAVKVLANWMSLVRTPEGRMQLRFTGVPGLQHKVQRSADLKVWTDMTMVTPTAPDGQFQWTDTSPLPLKGYYRLSGPH